MNLTNTSASAGLQLQITLTLLLILLPITIYFYYKRKHSYWAEKGVPYFPPSIPFGNIGDFVLRKTSILHLMRNIYIESKLNGYRYTGVYLYARKGLFIVDPSLVKRILSTDFQYFHDRDIYYDEKNDPLTANLVALTGQKWKNLRAKLTPTFTSGKLKGMFNTVLNCGEELKKSVNEQVNAPIEIKDLLSRFTTDVIGCCAFGIDCNSLKDPDTEFCKYSKIAMTQGLRDILKLVLYKNFPRLARFFKVTVVNGDVSNFFMNIVKQTIEHREQNNVVRNDFMQLLIQLKNNGKLDEDENNQTTTTTTTTTKVRENFKVTFNEIAAQSFIFFLAGYETSSTVTSLALYEIAQNSMIQEKLRCEIFDVIKRHNGEITYDAIMEMEYMEKVINESMRKYPAVPVLLRKCTKNYKIPETEVIIEKDTPVFVSVWGMHSDPEYFPEPDKFIPERFDKAKIQDRPEYSYLPFGDGPRICIGLRFGMMQIKIALSILLSNFEFTLNENTSVPLVFDKNRQAVLHPIGGITLNVFKIGDNKK